MSEQFDCADPLHRSRGLTRATSALQRGRLVVVPTDTVYGLAADAFDPAATAHLLATKGRGRSMPPPVLVPHPDTVHGLAVGLSAQVRALMAAFWPGGLTLVCRSQPSLRWDLGDTEGTVALRMPLHPVTLELLTATGPLAVSSANRTGQPAATTCGQARDQLGEDVEVYLDAGRSAVAVASTIVDTTTSPPRVLRDGAVSLAALREVVPEIAHADDPPTSAGTTDPAVDRGTQA